MTGSASLSWWLYSNRGRAVLPDAHSFRARASWRHTGRECYIEKGGATPEGPSTPVGTGVWLCACAYHSPSFFRHPEEMREKRESRINARLCNNFVIIPVLPLKLLLLFTLITAE